MEEWVTINNINSNQKNLEYEVDPNCTQNYSLYKLRKGDIIPITLSQAIAQTDLIFNSGAFKVKEICKDDGVSVVFRMEYIKEDSEPNEN